MSYTVRNIIVVLLGIALLIGTPFIVNSRYHYNTNEDFAILEETVKSAYLSDDNLIQIPENVDLDMSDAPEQISASLIYTPYEYVVGKIIDGKFQTTRHKNMSSIRLDIIGISLLVTIVYAIIAMTIMVLYDTYISPYFKKLSYERSQKRLAKKLQKACEEGTQ